MTNRDESTQFSLKELLKLEDERVSEQERERQALAAARLRDKAAFEQKQRADAHAKAKADAEELERRRRAELDELAHREAVQKAVVEQARLAVDVRARAEERELERRHELELHRLRSDGAKVGLLPLGGAALLGGVVMLAVVLAVHYGVLKPAQVRASVEQEQRTLAAETRVTDVTRQAEEQRRVLAELEQKLRGAETELQSLRTAKSATSATLASSPALHPRPPAAPDHAPPATPPLEPICKKGDPMCFTVGR